MSENESLKGLQKHRDFWQQANVECPLVGIHHCLASFDSFQWGNLHDGALIPDHLSLPQLLQQYERNFLEQGLWEGDLLWIAFPPGTVPWMESIMGARAVVSVSGHSMWSEPTLDRWAELDRVADYKNSPWLGKLIEITKGLVSLSAGRFPIAMPLQRGPLDIAAALRGQTQVCLDFYDSPRQLRTLLEICAEANLYVAEVLASVIPEFFGGHANYFGLWSPGWPYLHQEDAMASFSPQAYRGLIKDSDELIMGKFDHSIRKLHSSSLHVLEDALDMEAVAGIQVTVDPNGPPVEELVTIFGKIQARKPLLVNCYSREIMNTLSGSLSPRGLCLVDYEAVDQTTGTARE